jgi:hypothetical protein
MENKVINIVKYTFFIIGLVLLALAVYLKGNALMVLMILGLVFFSIGAGIMAFEWKTKQKEEDLRRNGQVVQAELQGVQLNEAIEVNGKSPFQIVAQWHDKNSNQMYAYTSANLWYDPSGFLENKKTVPVYIDSHNPARYFMDISFLPKKAN